MVVSIEWVSFQSLDDAFDWLAQSEDDVEELCLSWQQIGAQLMRANNTTSLLSYSLNCFEKATQRKMFH